MPKPFLSFIDPHKNPNFREIIAHLNEGISHGDNLERIDFPGLPPHLKVFSTRENIKGRFIFVRMPILQEMHFILVKHLPSHEYEKFKRENLAYTLKKNLPLFEGIVAERQQVSTAIAAVTGESSDEMDFKHLQQQFKQFVAECSQDGELHLLFSDLHQKPILLTEEQRKIYYTSSSLLIKGNPGSGKTLLLFAQLGRFIEHARENSDTRPIVYIAPSPRFRVDRSVASLVPTLRRAWREHPASQHLPCSVNFFTVEEFIAHIFPEIPARLVPPTCFYDWFAHFSNLRSILSSDKHKQLTTHALPDRVYQEICLIAGLTDDNDELNESAYFAIGKQEVLFPEIDMRALMLQIAKTYLRFLNQESLIDLALNPPSFPSHYAQRLLLDELQDYPLALFKKIIKAAPHVTCCMDSKQSQQVMIPQEKRLKQLLIQYDSSVTIFNLIPSFRCPTRIVAAANRILGVNKLLAQGAVSKNESLVFASNLFNNGLFKIVDRNNLPDTLIELSHSADFLPIYFPGDDPIPALRHRHHALANQVNGLELADGALFLSQKVFGKISRLLQQLKEQGIEPSFNRAKTGKLVTDHILLMNALFTAATRFSRSLWLVVESQADLEGLLHYLKEPAHLTPEEEKGFDVKVSTSAEWRERGNDYRDKGLINQAREAFANAGLSPDEIEQILLSELEQQTTEPAPVSTQKKKKKNSAAVLSTVVSSTAAAMSTPGAVNNGLMGSTCHDLPMSFGESSAGSNALTEKPHDRAPEVEDQQSFKTLFSTNIADFVSLTPQDSLAADPPLTLAPAVAGPEEGSVDNVNASLRSPKQKHYNILTHSTITELIKLFENYSINTFIEQLDKSDTVQNLISAIAFDIPLFKNIFYKKFNVTLIRRCLKSMNGPALINFLLKNSQGEFENNVVAAFRLDFELASVNIKTNVCFFDLPHCIDGRKLLKTILNKHPDLLDSLHPNVMTLEIRSPGSILHTWATLMPDLICFISEKKWDWLQKIPLSAWTKNYDQSNAQSAATYFIFISQYSYMDSMALDALCEYLFTHVDLSFWHNSIIPLAMSEKGCKRLRQLMQLKPALLTTLQELLNHFMGDQPTADSLLMSHFFQSHSGREIIYDLAPNRVIHKFWTRSYHKQGHTLVQTESFEIQPCELYYYLSSEQAALQLLALMEKCPLLFLTLDYTLLKRSMSLSANISFSLLDLFHIEGPRKTAFNKLLDINPTVRDHENKATYPPALINLDFLDKHIIEDLFSNLSNTDRLFSTHFLNNHFQFFLENTIYRDLLIRGIKTSSIAARETFTRAFFQDNAILPHWSINKEMNISLLLLKLSPTLAPDFLPLFFKKYHIKQNNRIVHGSIFHFWAKSDNTLLQLYKKIPDFIARVPENIWLEECDNLTTFEALWDKKKLFLAEKVCEVYPQLAKKLGNIFYRTEESTTQFDFFNLLNYIKRTQSHLPRLNAVLTEITHATDDIQIIPTHHLISRIVGPRLAAQKTPDSHLRAENIIKIRGLLSSNENKYVEYITSQSHEHIIEIMHLDSGLLDKAFLQSQFNENYIRESFKYEEGRQIVYFLMTHLGESFKQSVFHVISKNLDEARIDTKKPNYFVLLACCIHGCNILNLFLRENIHVLDHFSSELWSKPFYSTRSCLSFLANHNLELLCFIAEKKPDWFKTISTSHWCTGTETGESAIQNAISVSLETIEEPGFNILFNHLFTHCPWQTWIQVCHADTKVSPLERLSFYDRGCRMLQTLSNLNRDFNVFLQKEISKSLNEKVNNMSYLLHNLILSPTGCLILFRLAPNMKINNKFWTTCRQSSALINSKNMDSIYAPPLYHLLSSDPSALLSIEFIEKCPKLFKEITLRDLTQPMRNTEYDNLLSMAGRGEIQRRILRKILTINNIELKHLDKIELSRCITFYDFRVRGLIENVDTLTCFLSQKTIEANLSFLLKEIFTSLIDVFIERIQTASQQSIENFTIALFENNYAHYFAQPDSLKVFFELFKRCTSLEDRFSKALCEKNTFNLFHPPVKSSMMAFLTLANPDLLMAIDTFRPDFLPSLPSDLWFEPVGPLLEIPFMEILREHSISLATKIYRKNVDRVECIPIPYWFFPDLSTKLPRVLGLMNLVVKKQIFCPELSQLALNIITKAPDHFWAYFFLPQETRKDLLLREYILDLFLGCPEGLQKLVYLIKNKHCSFEESIVSLWYQPSDAPFQFNDLVSLLRESPPSEAKDFIIEHLLGSPALKKEELTVFRKVMRRKPLSEEYLALEKAYKADHAAKNEPLPSPAACQSSFFNASSSDKDSKEAARTSLELERSATDATKINSSRITQDNGVYH